MARIQGPSGSGGGSVTTVPFIGQEFVDVIHQLGRRPIVEILVQTQRGLFGIESFGTGGFGAMEAYEPMDRADYNILHLSADQFQVTMVSPFDGEVLFT